MFISLAGHGRYTKAGDGFMEEAIEIGVRLKLFGVDDALSLEDVEDISPDQQIALAQTTWGAFNIIM
jgi:hypothetical protein